MLPPGFVLGTASKMESQASSEELFGSVVDRGQLDGELLAGVGLGYAHSQPGFPTAVYANPAGVFYGWGERGGPLCIRS